MGISTHQVLGVVFPGQGSQVVGMLSDVAREYREVEETFAECSDILDYDLWKLVQHGPKEELDKTFHTQPALLAASYAIWRILKKENHLEPTLLAGHSLGEYTALVCAGALSFSDAVRVVAARGHYMQEATPVGVGALAAIVGLEDDVVRKLCADAMQPNEILAPANFNSPGQVVVAGHTQAVERVLILAKESDARLAKLLPVSVPSHCVLMEPAAKRLRTLLDNIHFNSPHIPVVNNVDVALYKSATDIRDGLVRQLFMPVQWVATINYFAKSGITHIVECGPQKVLNGLNKRIAPTIELSNTNDLAAIHALQDLLRREHVGTG